MFPFINIPLFGGTNFPPFPLNGTRPQSMNTNDLGQNTNMTAPPTPAYGFDPAALMNPTATSSNSNPTTTTVLNGTGNASYFSVHTSWSGDRQMFSNQSGNLAHSAQQSMSAGRSENGRGPLNGWTAPNNMTAGTTVTNLIYGDQFSGPSVSSSIYVQDGPPLSGMMTPQQRARWAALPSWGVDTNSAQTNSFGSTSFTHNQTSSIGAGAGGTHASTGEGSQYGFTPMVTNAGTSVSIPGISGGGISARGTIGTPGFSHLPDHQRITSLPPSEDERVMANRETREGDDSSESLEEGELPDADGDPHLSENRLLDERSLDLEPQTPHHSRQSDFTRQSRGLNSPRHGPQTEERSYSDKGFNHRGKNTISRQFAHKNDGQGGGRSAEPPIQLGKPPRSGYGRRGGGSTHQPGKNAPQQVPTFAEDHSRTYGDLNSPKLNTEPASLAVPQDLLRQEADRAMVDFANRKVNDNDIVKEGGVHPIFMGTLLEKPSGVSNNESQPRPPRKKETVWRDLSHRTDEDLTREFGPDWIHSPDFLAQARELSALRKEMEERQAAEKKEKDRKHAEQLETGRKAAEQLAAERRAAKLAKEREAAQEKEASEKRALDIKAFREACMKKAATMTKAKQTPSVPPTPISSTPVHAAASQYRAPKPAATTPSIPGLLVQQSEEADSASAMASERNVAEDEVGGIEVSKAAGSRRKRPVASDMYSSQDAKRARWGAPHAEPIIIDLSGDEEEEEEEANKAGQASRLRNTPLLSRSNSEISNLRDPSNAKKRKHDELQMKRERKEAEMERLKERIATMQKKQRLGKKVSSVAPTPPVTPSVGLGPTQPPTKQPGAASMANTSETTMPNTTKQEIAMPQNAGVHKKEVEIEEEQKGKPESANTAENNNKTSTPEATMVKIKQEDERSEKTPEVNSTDARKRSRGKVLRQKLIEERLKLLERQAAVELEEKKKLLLQQMEQDAQDESDDSDTEQVMQIQADNVKARHEEDIEMGGSLDVSAAPSLPREHSPAKEIPATDLDAVDVRLLQSEQDEIDRDAEYEPTDELPPVSTPKAMTPEPKVTDAPAPSTQGEQSVGKAGVESSADLSCESSAESSDSSSDDSSDESSDEVEGGESAVIGTVLESDASIAAHTDFRAPKPAEPVDAAEAAEIPKADTISYTTFTPYVSPFVGFKRWRHHPYFQQSDSAPKLGSITYSSHLDPSRTLCEFETRGGTCNDSTCESLHLRDLEMREDEILVELADPQGDTEDEKSQYGGGLREIVVDLKEKNIRNFNQVAERLLNYRLDYLKRKLGPS